MKRRKLRISVGLKVAGMVVVFEVIMFVAYTIVTNVFVDAEQFLERLNLNQQNVIIGLLIASLVLAGYLTFLVITRIFNPVTELTRGTEEIMKGNLGYRLRVKTHDELEILAERFNAMAAALKEERDSLENKVMERTRALEVSQKKELENHKDVLRLKDELLFVAAHELRTPVTAIRWSLESVADQKRTPAPVQEAMADAVESSKRLSELVEDLLNMARLDSKRITFAKEPVDLAEVAKAVQRELNPLAEKRSIKLTTEISKDLSRHAMADARRVREIMINLVGNGIKFNHPGGRVTIHVGESGDQMLLSVEDDAHGIPPEEQKHLFEKFWRSPTHAGVEGTGLGLFITKRLVEGMEGTIDCESAVGKGTTFHVRLPAARAA